uniref:Zinc finger and BTB domain containing 49 n=1 Tax=Hucho hucho TaxID=62062 RepID=A0A4W5P3A4_9TELE
MLSSSVLCLFSSCFDGHTSLGHLKTALKSMDTLSSHSAYLLQQLQEQRIQGLLCDCMLVVKGVCFKAHKNVLAAFSSYFRSLFQNSPSQKNDVFQLVIQDVGGIGQILDYMYTSHLDVNQDNVQALLDIAQCLQVPNVQSMCNTFLKPSTPAVEAPSFSLSGVLTSEHDYLLGTGLAQDVDLPCPSSVGQRSAFGSGAPVSHGGNATSETTAITQPVPEKQLVHGYKLRNFYSKQYFKQSAAAETSNAALNQGPSPLVLVEEQQFQFGVTQPCMNAPVCSGNAVQSNPPCPQAMAAEKEFGSTLPAEDLSTTANSGGKVSPVNKPMRPKKAVYLKKYNYLRPQKALEEMCLEQSSKPVNHCPKEIHQEEVVVQSETPEATVDCLPPIDCLARDREVVLETAMDPQLPSPPPVDQEEEPDPPTISDPTEPTGHKVQYCCEMCGKTFKHPSNLELHKRSHTGEKPFQCNVCRKNFSQAGNLQTHLRRHSGEKPYICELCGKSFAASGDVQRHIVIHTGERPHLCDICGRGFSNISNLKEHKKTHTTDREFTCDQCGKSFNMHRKLLKHKIRHSGEKPHTCQTCGKSFAGSGDLRRHVRTHTGERPYLCNTCGKSFTRSAVLRRHCSMHCKATPDDASPDVEDPEQPGSSSTDGGGGPFHKPVSHSKAPEPRQPPPTSTTVMELDKPSPPPAHTEAPSTSIHLSPSASFPELRSIVPQHLLPSTPSQQQEKCPPLADSLKLGKAHLPQEALVFGPYVENGPVGVEIQQQGSGASVVARPYLSAPDSYCGALPGASRPSGTPYRASEGPFFSSVTLWGLAMKTLQNDNDLEQ